MQTFDFVKSNPRVLIVDDDPAIRLLLRDTLEVVGFTVAEAETGEEGLRLFSGFTPDIVLLDVLLPDADGFSLCTNIRNHVPGGELIPIVMITALEDISSINQAYASGATDFITKPIHWTLLTHRLRYMLRVSALSHELAHKERMLKKAQRIAQLGSWELALMDGHFSCTEQTRYIFSIPIETPLSYKDLENCVHEDDRRKFSLLIEQAKSGQAFAMEHRVAVGKETVRTVYQQVEIERSSDGTSGVLIGTVQDITQRKQAEERIRYLAYFDQLTGFANRVLFRELVEKALAMATRQHTLCALMLLDVDDFKRINDNYGHSAGDTVLREFANRLKQCLRDSDAIARQKSTLDQPSVNMSRLGGDEFTILLNGFETTETVTLVAQRIVNAMQVPFIIDDHQTLITTSIGIACFPDDGQDVDALIRHADTAMYSAKRRGKNMFQVYGPTQPGNVNM